MLCFLYTDPECDLLRDEFVCKGENTTECAIGWAAAVWVFRDVVGYCDMILGDAELRVIRRGVVRGSDSSMQRWRGVRGRAVV